MPNLSNTNYNHVSVKTDSMVKMLEQLAKLGVFKSKPKKRKSSKSASDIRQDNDMVGSVMSLEGEAGRGDPNLFALRQIEPGMSQQEIADVQERNNAGIAALRAEVAQQRLEDVRQQERLVGGLATAAAGKFGQLESGLADIRSGKFGASSEPMRQSSVILLPDVQEETFTQSLNEGGPLSKPAVQTEFFSGTGEEEEGIPTSGGGKPFQPIQAIRSPRASGVVKKRDAVASTFGLGLVPKINQTSPAQMKAYYLALFDAVQEDPDDSITSKAGYFKAINDYLDSVVLAD